MAWRKTFPSPLLLLFFILLAFNILNATSHALHPTEFSLSTHMREYAVYANEDGVPKLERGDSPAQDPQIIQDSPIPTVTPKLFQASPTPTSAPSFSENTAAVTVSAQVTPTSSPQDEHPTVSDDGSASSFSKPSASASPTVAPTSPGPTPQISPSSQSVSVSAVENDSIESDLFADDLDISATSDDEPELEPELEPEETIDLSHEQASDPHFDDDAKQPLLAAAPVAISQQPAPSQNVFKPESSSLSAAQASAVESSKPSTSDDEEEPFESPLVDDALFTPTPLKTATPPGEKKNGNPKPSQLFNSKAPVQLHLGEDLPAPKPEPSQSVSPLPSPSQPYMEEETMDSSANHLGSDTSVLEDDQLLESSFEDQVMISEVEVVPVAVGPEGADESVSDTSAPPVATAIPPPLSSESPASAASTGDKSPSISVDETSNEAQSHFGNLEIDESFTCTSFGKGSVPNFDKPDDNSYTGDVASFAVDADDFPDLAPQYLSHVHGTSWSYSFSVDESFVYDVVLGFAEIYDVACNAGEESGYRIFDTWVGDQTTRIDVMAVAGCGKPLQKVYPKITPSGSTITMVFKQVSQHAMLSTLCYRKAGVANSKSPATEPKPSPLKESNPIATAIPPASPLQGESVLTDEQPDSNPEGTKLTGAVSQLGSSYTCVNFGLEVINGYAMYDRKAVSGDAHVFAGSGQYQNTLPEPYWYYLYGQNWSYSLEVSSSAPQNLVLGYAETSSEACDMDRSFTVSANGGIQTAEITENIGCGVIHQTELAAVAPVNGVIDLSFTAVSGDALVSVLCYADAVETETETAVIVGIESTPEESGEDPEDESPTLSEEANTESTSVVVQSDSTNEAGKGGSCFSFGSSSASGFVNAVPLPQDVSYYSDAKASISGAQESSVFSSHIYGSHFSLTISNMDQAPKSVFIGLAEIYEPACKEEQRLFSVTVGSLTKTIDVFDEVGCSAAMVLRIDEVTPNTANNIVIGFNAVKDNAMVSAVCVTESVENSTGEPSALLVSKLPPLSMLDNSAAVTILSEQPVPSPTVVTVSLPSDTGSESSDTEESQSDDIVSSGEKGDGNPKGSPFPEFNGLIDATISESPAPIGSNVATNPLPGLDEGEENGNLVHPDISATVSQEGEAHHGDILLPTDFSQTTFGKTPVLASSSTLGLSPDGVASDAPMHPTGSESSGFPQSAAVEDVESKQIEDGISTESSEVIVVLEENAVSSPSPSATSSPVLNIDTEAHNNGPQTIQQTSDSSPIPTTGVIIVAQGGDPANEAPSPSATPIPSASPDSGVTISVGDGGEQQESPTPVNDSAASSSPSASEVTLDMEQQGSSQESQSPTISPLTQSPISDSTVILVAENENPAILSTPEESAVTITDSDAEDQPEASPMPVEGILEEFPTAIPPGSSSTVLESSDEGSSNDSDEEVIVAVDSDPATVSTDAQQIPSLSPTPVSVAIPPKDTPPDGTADDETEEVQILVPDSGETPSSSSSSPSVDGAVVIPVDATEISSQQPTPSTAAAIPPAATVTDNQIEIVVTGSPTVTPIPGTTSASSPGDDVQDVVIIGSETSDSDSSAVEAPDGVSLGGINPDGSSSDVTGAASPSPSPTPSLIVSVTGSDTVIIGSTGAEASPVPVTSGIPVAAPEAVAEVPDDDANVIQVSDSENAEPVDSSALTGDEDVPSIIEGEYKELIGTVPAGSGFSIGMGVLGALLVLLLLVLLFFAIRSDGVAYSYSSQYSSRKPSDYGDASQGGYTEGLNQGAGVYQNDSYAGDGVSGYAQGQPPVESQPIAGAENFGYEQPQEGLGGVNGSYGNVGPDTYAAYSSLNMHDAPTTMGDETNMYTQSETMTADGGLMFKYGSGTRDTTFSGTGLRESEQPTEYDEAATQNPTEVVSHGEVPTSMMEETLPGTSEFEQRISMFGGRRGSQRISSGQETGEENSFHDNRSVARPNIESASSGNQGREHGLILQGTGYETVTKEMKEQYNFLQEAYLERDAGDVPNPPAESELEGSERMLSMSSTPTAAPSPYETDMQGQLVTDSDSGNVSYQQSPMLAPSESLSGASGDIRHNHVLRRVRNGDIHDDSVLDDYQHNESSVRESARQGQGHGTMELRSDLSNDGPWPWWWSDQKDQKGIFEESPGRLEPEVFDKENSSLPSNNQSPVEQSSSGLSTEDAKAAVVVDDTAILKPSEIAKLGHLPTVGSKWQRQYSSTSDGTSRERFENNPYFDELRKRREPYVKTVANRLSTGVKAYSTESGESILEQARKEFEEQHSQQPSVRFNDNDPSSWVTQGVEV